MSWPLNPFTGEFDYTKDTPAAPVVNVVYFGPSDVDGSWRIIPESDALLIQKRESGQWVTKGGAS